MLAEQSKSVSFVPTADNTRLLRDAFGQFATGVTVITTSTPKGPVAITANSFTSVSLDPALVLWALDRKSFRFPAFQSAKHFAIHVLSETQDDICWKVAKDGQALGDLDLPSDAQGVPVIEGCLARFECQTFAMHTAGDHELIVGRVLRAELDSTPESLAFFRGKIRQLVPES